MNTVVLDTDTLSAIMRQDSTAVSVAQQYLKVHATLTISIITRFEILRGLMAKNATSQISAFNATCLAIEVLPFNDAIIVRAAEIYGQLHRAGNLIGDADIVDFDLTGDGSSGSFFWLSFDLFSIVLWLD